MKPTKVSVLISKKVSKDWNSYSLSYGVTAELDPGESYSNAILRLDREIKELLEQGFIPRNKLRVAL